MSTPSITGPAVAGMDFGRVACIVIDVPGVSATIVLRGQEVPDNPPSQAEALILLEKVLRLARGEQTGGQHDGR